jgi:hypothetical protein
LRGRDTGVWVEAITAATATVVMSAPPRIHAKRFGSLSSAMPHCKANRRSQRTASLSEMPAFRRPSSGGVPWRKYSSGGAATINPEDGRAAASRRGTSSYAHPNFRARNCRQSEYLRNQTRARRLQEHELLTSRIAPRVSVSHSRMCPESSGVKKPRRLLDAPKHDPRKQRRRMQSHHPGPGRMLARQRHGFKWSNFIDCVGDRRLEAVP